MSGIEACRLLINQYTEGRFMKESTMNIMKLHGWRIDRFLHHYIYFTYYHTYIRLLTCGLVPYTKKLNKLRETNARQGFMIKLVGKILDIAMSPVVNRYHGKVISRDDVTKIINLEESIDLGVDDSKRIIPYKYARRIIFSEPTHFAAMECPCKATMPEHERCRPSKSCIAVGKNLVSFWLDHGKKYGVEKLTKEQVLERIDELRKTGHFNQAYFKVATGGRTGVICNCCDKCCGGSAGFAQLRDFNTRYRDRLAKVKSGQLDTLEHPCSSAPSGYTVKHDPEKCDLSGECEKICQFDAVKITNGKYRYDPVLCMGCGLCVEHCPHGALNLVFRDTGGYIPLDIDLIKERQKRSA